MNIRKVHQARFFIAIPINVCIMCVYIFCIGCANSKLQTKSIANVVDNTIKPMMAKIKIPGMAVAVTINNKAYFFNYGFMSRQAEAPITNNSTFGF